MSVKGERDSLVKKLQSDGIPTAVGPYSEIFKEDAFSDVDFEAPKSLPAAEDLGKRSMTFLVYPGMNIAIPRLLAKYHRLLLEFRELMRDTQH